MKRYLLRKGIINKIILLKSIAFVSVSGAIYGQQSTGSAKPDKITPATPETYSIFKAGDFPVDYRTGKLNISIPIYTINTRYGLSIPINLTYNTGGIKVDETSSTVGLGWSLAVPNSISVEQHGKSDLNNIAKWFPTNPFDYVYTGVNLESLPVDIRTKLYALADGLQDMQPDIFHYNLPTISGSFVMDSNGNFHTIPYENIKISYSDANSFEITDPKGIVYTFGRGNRISSMAGLSSDSSLSSFFLSKIKLPTNEEISFKYEKQMLYQTTTYSYQDVYAQADDNVECRGAVEDTSDATTNRYTDRLLTEIKYENETVTFTYKNTIDGTLGRKDINADSVENSFALDQIIINNSAGNTIGNFKLNQTYFGSGNGPNYKNFRLKLTRVDNLLENNRYSFDYNEAYQPALESFGQDIWGYYNGKIENRGLIPNMRYFNINYTKGGDRNVYPQYSQAFMLKKVTYPTGGTSAFEFENNTVWDQLLIPQKQEITYGVINNYYDNSQNENDLITKTTPSSEYFYINQGTQGEELWVEFMNSCSNQIPNQLPENGSSSGTAYLEEFVNNHWIILAQFDGPDTTGVLSDNKFFLNPSAPKRIRTVRKGNCSVYLKIYKTTYSKSNGQNNPVGGLRIKSITDSDGTTSYTKRQFEYNNPNFSGNRSSAFFASPLEFLKSIYKVFRNTGATYDVFCNPYALSADQASNSSLMGKDVVNYEYVTEHTLGKGRKVFKYNVIDNAMDISIVGGNGFNPYQFNNKNLLSETSYLLNGTTPVKEIIYKYTPTYFKNTLSSNYSSGNAGQIIPSTVMGIYKTAAGSLQNAVYTTRILSHYPIQAGKFLLNEVMTNDYTNGNMISTKVANAYSIDDINKPINLKTTSVLSPDNSVSETTYQYAHEKGNQKLINANMIGIPLETSVVEKPNATVAGKTTARSETKYDDPAHLFPTSILSYNVLNSESSTEVTYNKYDTKGNIQQYTTKDGIPTAIVWGYNNTQPIAKVQGVSYDQLVNLGIITAIVNASNADASNPANEPALITALDTFRKNSGLSAYQVSTYTYDPLIGVTSITAPSGIREVYIYDTANRLKEIRQDSKTGSLVKEFKYNYK
ncbi:hypothetical protein CEY12_21595 [Chryseobacterium sp. T16E-39]|uniref:hypothetical protein n=1 Tax=Chryseobacterium sp. T16E-39 TaxID=2015076 RepID=UPI000B5B3248|nr:hypothetical protein [Chryseobacterium sp. T16E-39]ASK32519.1 hypothetical protein CEY12_21595 [Chryseobacterium sp. T16E-39]